MTGRSTKVSKRLMTKWEMGLMGQGLEVGCSCTENILKAACHWPYVMNEVTFSYIHAQRCFTKCVSQSEQWGLTLKVVGVQENSIEDGLRQSLIAIYVHWKARGNEYEECADELYETLFKPLGIEVGWST